MHTQTFANRSIGTHVVRATAGILNAVTGAFVPVWNFLGALGQARARKELLRMADSHAESRPEFAAQLRAAAHRSWYGEI